MTPAPQLTPVLELRGVRKRFGTIIANFDVDIAIARGEIRGLVGENGAGKTTIMNVASGLYRPDAGQILVEGGERRFDGPLDAIRAGVNMVHQNFLLAENLTAAENIVLGTRRGRERLQMSVINRAVRELADRYEMPVVPDQPVWNMPVAQRQRVAILSALYRDCRVLVLDEPTSALSPPQIDSLLRTVRTLAAEGRSIVFITHKLHEVIGVCTSVTVMRKGQVVGNFQRAEVDVDSLARLMVGHELAPERPMRSRGPAEPLFHASGVTVLGDHGEVAVDSVSLEVRSGEVLGLAGVDGNGQRELIGSIAGLRPMVAGTISRAGVGAERPVAYIPDDARAEALVPAMSVVWNVGLRHYRLGRGKRLSWLVDFKSLRRLAADCVARFDVRGGGLDLPAASLSGGNLQKLVLARELSFGANVVLAVNPTAGLDVASAAFVHEILDRERQRGAAVVLVSGDLDEIFKLSDRIAVMYRGQIVHEVGADDATREQIGRAMTGLGSVQAAGA